LPTKEKLFGEFKNKDLMILAVSFHEPEDLVRDFQKEFKLSFPVLLDPHGKVSDRYEFRGHPVTFLIDRKGFLVGKVLGERNWSSPEAKALIIDLLRKDP
jgi:peroxiredoxin